MRADEIFPRFLFVRGSAFGGELLVLGDAFPRGDLCVAAFGGEPFVFTPESAVAPKRENEPREGERGGGGGENADVRNVFHD